MSSRKRGRQQRQQRLAFEPIVATAEDAATASNDSPLGKGLSPARVRFSSSGRKEGSPSGSRSVRSLDMARTKKKSKKQQQQTLEVSLGKCSLFPDTMISGHRQEII